MSDERASDSVPFDLERIKELIHLMEEHDLTEVDLHKGDQRCRLRRGPQGVVPMMPGPYPAALAQSAPQAASASGSSGTAQSSAVPDGTVVIKSPTVGTFYSAASPEDEPFAKVGTPVEPDTVVCLVEAMKVYNQITADVKGTITEVLVANGDAIEFGQPLFRVRAS
jgi:acetyl-CoA carboxylase biotin carboxyl carrier protein